MRPKMPDVLRVCLYCGGLFYARQSQVRMPGGGQYCSKSCQSKVRVGELNSNWKGGIVAFQGREVVYAPDHPDANLFNHSHILAYRLVAEKKISRRLLPTEIVHHINGDTHDNRPENLEVMTLSRHAQHHALSRERDSVTGRFL